MSFSISIKLNITTIINTYRLINNTLKDMVVAIVTRYKIILNLFSVSLNMIINITTNVIITMKIKT